MTEKAAALVARIADYLGNGGFWNPELMDHEAVRDLLMACRDDLLSSPSAAPAGVQPVMKLRVSVHARLGERTYAPELLDAKLPPGDYLLYAFPAPAAGNEDAAMLDWLDRACSEGNGRHICCIPGGLRDAIRAAMKDRA
jgi:hypothetical protein